LSRYNTGGSSGKPLVFYFDRRRQAYDAAARALTHRWWDIEGVDEFKIIQHTLDQVEVILKVHKDIYPDNGGGAYCERL